MNVIDMILRREEFQNDPPVLLDIGASGAFHKKWKRIAPYAICIAFDADAREIGFMTKPSSHYKKLIVYNSIVSDEANESTDFFLTGSPYCSSVLEPDKEKLSSWAFARLFDVEKKITLRAHDLPGVLKEVRVKRIDWFKTDSQGIDLRLFESLSEEILRKVIIAEFEPGIIDAYHGEDKLWQLFAAMDKKPFWMSSITVKGSQRLSTTDAEKYFSRFQIRFMPFLLPSSPGWGEVLYMNTFANAELFSLREFFLGWIVAMTERQYGFALELGRKGREHFGDPLFTRLEKIALRKIYFQYLKAPFRIVWKKLHSFAG